MLAGGSQRTAQRRVYSFLLKQHFNVLECEGVLAREEAAEQYARWQPSVRSPSSYPHLLLSLHGVLYIYSRTTHIHQVPHAPDFILSDAVVLKGGSSWEHRLVAKQKQKQDIFEARWVRGSSGSRPYTKDLPRELVNTIITHVINWTRTRGQNAGEHLGT